jgi:hypothetical protein
VRPDQQAGARAEPVKRHAETPESECLVTEPLTVTIQN